MRKWLTESLGTAILGWLVSRLGPDLLPYFILVGAIFLTWEGLRELAKTERGKRFLKLITATIGKPMSYILAASVGLAFGTGYWWAIQRITQEQTPAPTTVSPPVLPRPRIDGDHVSDIEALLGDVRDSDYRRLVAAVIHAFEPKAELAVGALVNTPDGTRKIDIEVRSSDRSRLTAIDIVDLPTGRKAGIEVVDAAQSKRTDVKADAILICSNTGFDEIAIRKAKRSKVGLISVLRRGDERVKAIIEEVMYLRKVDLAPITFNYTGETEAPPNVKMHDLKYQGDSVDEWLVFRAIRIVNFNPTIERALLASFNLKNPTEFEVGQKRIKLNSFSISFHPHVKWFSQTVQLDATTGIYDYVRGKIQLAPGKNSYTVQGIDIHKATPLSSPPETDDLQGGLIPREVKIDVSFFDIPVGVGDYSRTIEALVRPEDLIDSIDSMH